MSGLPRAGRVGGPQGLSRGAPALRALALSELRRGGPAAAARALGAALPGGLEGLRARARASLEGSAAEPAPLFACGDYLPRAAARKGRGAGARPGYSESLLGLKSLRTRGAFASRDGSEALCRLLAVRLARGLRRLLAGGGLGAAPGPVLVSPVPGAPAGAPSFGLCRVADLACALAGTEFAFCVLMLRESSVPPAHTTAGRRGPAAHLGTLLPLPPPLPGGPRVALVDDVVSSGATLRAAAALVGALPGGPRAVGLALGRTPAIFRDGGRVRLLLPGGRAGG